jgi:hypothetical protein
MRLSLLSASPYFYFWLIAGPKSLIAVLPNPNHNQSEIGYLA